MFQPYIRKRLPNDKNRAKYHTPKGFDIRLIMEQYKHLELFLLFFFCNLPDQDAIQSNEIICMALFDLLLKMFLHG